MLIENYKGVDILHDANKDEFYTSIVIKKGSGSRKNEYIKASRLQKIRDDVDKFLNTSAKRPILKKAWLKESYGSTYKLVDVILFNSISNSIQVRDNDGNLKTITLNDYNRKGDLYLDCAENKANILLLNKKHDEIKKIEKETSCTGGKLIPLKTEHFK